MQRNHCTATPEIIAEQINHCCLKHDEAYVAQVDKIKADIDFYNCVADAIGIIAAIIIAGAAAVGGIWFWYRRKFKNMLR